MATLQGGKAEATVQVRRTFAAPREKVFDAWVNPRMMAKWFTRAGLDQPEVEILEADARPGGKYRVVNTCTQGIFRIQGTYKEVRPPEKLIFTWWFEGADFETSTVTVEFHTLGSSAFTEVILTHELLPEKERENHRKGWTGCLEELAQVLG